MTFISLKNKFAKNYHEVTKTPSREGKRYIKGREES